MPGPPRIVLTILCPPVDPLPPDKPIPEYDSGRFNIPPPGETPKGGGRSPPPRSRTPALFVFSTLNPTPYTLHPTPYTLHPESSILNPLP